MTGSHTTVRRFCVVGALGSAFMLIDGLVLLITNGLHSDATQVFPVLGGAFSKTRASGTSLIILGVRDLSAHRWSCPSGPLTKVANQRLGDAFRFEAEFGEAPL